MSEPNHEEEVCTCPACLLKSLFGEEAAAKMMEDRILSNLEEFGWSAMSVMEDEECRHMTYTIGLARKGKPDLIVVGLHPRMAHACLESFYYTEQELEEGREYRTLADNFPMRLVACSDELADEMRFSRWYMEKYQPDKKFHALKVVWPDLGGKFPGEEGFDMHCSQEVYRETPY